MEYDAGSLFTVHSEPIASLSDLARTLDKLRSRRDAFVIRGELKPGTSQPCVRRHKSPSDPFEERPRRWVMLDVDTRPDPDGTFCSDPASAAADIRATLPKPFQLATCYWHASGSAGIKPGVRLHLWFWCNRPVESIEWRVWVKQWSIALDSSVYRTVQPHYTGDPSLNFPDPLQKRSGTLAGELEVIVPEVVGASSTLQTLADSTLTKAVRLIRAAEEGARNSTLYYQATRVAQFAPLLGERAQATLYAAAESSSLGATEIAATIASAFASTAPHPACDRAKWSRALSLTQTGAIAISTANILQVFHSHPQAAGVLETDARTSEVRISRTPPWDEDEHYGPYPRRLTDADATDCAAWLDREVRMVGCTPRVVLEAMFAACRRRQVDHFREWLETLEWDGKPRLDNWLSITTHSDDPPAYLTAVGARWLISAVARTFQPGCKADCMLVLVGAQGARKSTLLERVAGTKWYRVMQSAMGGDDAYMQLQGPVIVELADLSGMSGRAVEQIKADLTTTIDERRPKYGRTVVAFPRRCVYAGTTNDDHFLSDVSGGRRFWPVHVRGTIDTDWMSANRDQLWAEAVARCRAGEQWHLTYAENRLAVVKQEHARESDLYEDALAGFLRAPCTSPLVPKAWQDEQRRIRRISCLAVAQLLELPLAHVKGRRIANALRAIGWVYTKTTTERYYVRPEDWK